MAAEAFLHAYVLPRSGEIRQLKLFQFVERIGSLNSYIPISYRLVGLNCIWTFAAVNNVRL